MVIMALQVQGFHPFFGLSTAVPDALLFVLCEHVARESMLESVAPKENSHALHSLAALMTYCSY